MRRGCVVIRREEGRTPDQSIRRSQGFKYEARRAMLLILVPDEMLNVPTVVASTFVGRYLRYYYYSAVCTRYEVDGNFGMPRWGTTGAYDELGFIEFRLQEQTWSMLIWCLDHKNMRKRAIAVYYWWFL